jgi:short-subunit dehydrogenase
MPIHFLINNAGVGLRGKVWETDIDRDIQMIHLNIISLVELTKLILPEMIERNEGQILMLGSIASFQPNPLLASYGATKAFIANYTDALIDELKDTNVTVTLLVPGVTDTVRIFSLLSLIVGFLRIFSIKLMLVKQKQITLIVQMIQRMLLNVVMMHLLMVNIEFMDRPKLN